MLQNLLAAVCNIGEGLTDLFETVLTKLETYDDPEGLANPETKALSIGIDVIRAIQEKPALRRLVAGYAGMVIGLDKFMSGQDYATAMNESRDQANAALSSPAFLFEAHEFYTKHRETVQGIVAEFDRIDDLDELNEVEKIALVMKTLRSIISQLRESTEPEYADAT